MKLFSKSLTATDCLKRLYIPEWVLDFLPNFHGGHAVELQVSCETGQWSIVCTIRRNGYKKPVLSKGWRKFVVGNRLSVGDELTLHREEDETGSLHYRVEVRKATRPFKAIRCNKAGKNKTVLLQVGNCSDQTSDHQSGISVVGIASASDGMKNSLSKHVDGVEEPEKKLKLFGSNILPGALVVGGGETVDSKAYANSFEQFGLTVDGAELLNSNGQASLRADHYSAKMKTAPTLEHLGLRVSTADGAFFHLNHDQATGRSYCRDEKRPVSELDKLLGQTIRGGAATVNLDLTLAPPIVSWE